MACPVAIAAAARTRAGWLSAVARMCSGECAVASAHSTPNSPGPSRPHKTTGIDCASSTFHTDPAAASPISRARTHRKLTLYPACESAQFQLCQLTAAPAGLLLTLKRSGPPAFGTLRDMVGALVVLGATSLTFDVRVEYASLNFHGHRKDHVGVCHIRDYDAAWPHGWRVITETGWMSFSLTRSAPLPYILPSVLLMDCRIEGEAR